MQSILFVSTVVQIGHCYIEFGFFITVFVLVLKSQFTKEKTSITKEI